MSSPNDSTVTKTTTTTTPSGLKTLYSTPSPFESKIGYYRAIRRGHQIFVSGTTAVDKTSPSTAPQIQYPGDAKKQTLVAFEESIRAIQALGGKGAESVVRVKMFVGRKDVCGVVGEGFREVFGKREDGDGEVGTAATMIVVQGGFVDDGMLVEVEVDAIVED